VYVLVFLESEMNTKFHEYVDQNVWYEAVKVKYHAFELKDTVNGPGISVDGKIVAAWFRDKKFGIIPK
jgi:hypothetical protein